MTAIQVKVNDAVLRAESEGVEADAKGTKRGELVVIDFFTQAALAGRAFQVRAGTITTPIVGDVAITDTAAEMCADAALGLTILPCELNIAVRLGTGTLHEYAAKSVGAVSSSGTAFVPLPLKMGGNAARSTARAQTAGAVTVAAELATTTRQHFHFANPVAVGAGNDALPVLWIPKIVPVLVGPACFYVQIAATGTGPSYYANFTYVELDSASV